MVPTNGPLQQTFVMIRVNPINPIHNVTVRVLFNFSWNNNAEYYAIDNEKKWGEGGGCDIYKPLNQKITSL